ncbi:unnamed protein product [Arctia plantaginis]|uniref:Uncharacterized protein n=1 Tax=Arctia plantaginis TaxID=874455 RepID=A0A8S0Z7H1_ARCPL|nr:unnamed protein product [Arctia plantaginis]CAB3228993.1 unnamed protein product [Arctia plantaginis]
MYEQLTKFEQVLASISVHLYITGKLEIFWTIATLGCGTTVVLNMKAYLFLTLVIFACGWVNVAQGAKLPRCKLSKPKPPVSVEEVPAPLPPSGGGSSDESSSAESESSQIVREVPSEESPNIENDSHINEGSSDESSTTDSGSSPIVRELPSEESLDTESAAPIGEDIAVNFPDVSSV